MLSLALQPERLSSPETQPAQEAIRSGKLSHLAIIMDGNRRWAKERGLPTLMGHKEGSQRLKEIIQACQALGLKGLSVYAFSTENWRRSQEEVGYLMRLMAQVLAQELDAIAALGVRIHLMGQPEALPQFLQKTLRQAQRRTQHNLGLTLQLAINYGGQRELALAAQALAREVQAGTRTPESIDEAALQAHLLGCSTLPAPELLIRTSGEQRLSNFMLWQCAYSELYFTPLTWPEFTVKALHEAMDSFAQRQQRFGV